LFRQLRPSRLRYFHSHYRNHISLTRPRDSSASRPQLHPFLKCIHRYVIREKTLFFLSKHFCYRRSRQGREVLRCKPSSQDNNGWKRFRFDKEKPQKLLANALEEQQQSGYFHTLPETCRQPQTWRESCELMINRPLRLGLWKVIVGEATPAGRCRTGGCGNGMSRPRTVGRSKCGFGGCRCTTITGVFRCMQKGLHPGSAFTTT